MIIIKGNFNYEIITGSIIQRIISQKNKNKKWAKFFPILSFEDEYIISTKVEAEYYLNHHFKDTNYRLLTPAGVDNWIKKFRSYRCLCKGNINPISLICDECNRTYRMIKGQLEPELIMPKIACVQGVTDYVNGKKINQNLNFNRLEEKAKFYEETSNKANKFKMMSTGSSVVDNHRMRNWNNLPKPIETDVLIKCICGDGKIRWLEYEFNNGELELVATHLDIVDIEIGEPVALIQDGYGIHAGYEVLRVKKYTGTMPCAESDYYRLRKIDHIPINIKKNNLNGPKFKRSKSQEFKSDFIELSEKEYKPNKFQRDKEYYLEKAAAERSAAKGH